MVFISDAIAWTFCPTTWKGWFRQRLRWTHGQMATLLKHKDIMISKNVVYRNLFILSIFDMLFMDIILIILRIAFLIWIFLFGFTENVVYAFVLLMIVYLINESVAFLTSAIFSPNKTDLKYVYLLPIIFLIYRPVYALVRVYAIVSAFIKRDIKW